MTQEEEETSLNINLKILGSPDLVEISLPTDITIESIKILASDYTDIPIEKMRLILTGRAMRNGTTLKNYDIHNGSTIHIVPERPRNNNNQPPPPQRPTPPPQNQTPPPPSSQSTQPPQVNYPTPSRELTELRSLVSNAQQKLSEISFAAATLQRAINQPSAGSSNEALATLCQRFNESFMELLNLNNRISSYRAVSPENNNSNDIHFEVNAQEYSQAEYQNDVSFGFNSVLNSFTNSIAPQEIVLQPETNSNPSNTPNESTSTSTTSTTTTSTTTTTVPTSQLGNQPFNQEQFSSISHTFQGEIAPGVPAMVNVEVVNEDNDNGNDDTIIEVNDINIDINDLNIEPTPLSPAIDSANPENPSQQSNENNETPNTETASSNQNEQERPQPSPPPIEEEFDLSQIVLDPEELDIVNRDAEILRTNFNPPVLDMNYSTHHFGASPL